MDKFCNLSELGVFLKKEGFIESIDIEDDLGIYGASSIYSTAPKTISWTRSMEIDWSEIQSSVVICPAGWELPSTTNIVLIPVENPRLVFIKILQNFFPKDKKAGIEDTAIIGKNCQISRNAYVGHHAVIGDNVNIGDDTIIYSNVAIYDNVTIGANCIINSGSVIGADGFGYERDGDVLMKFPHIGSVIIEDNVEIGSNTSIDRGTVSDTIINRNVKIDNLCHIAHNVVIEENAVIIACSMVGGSTRVGKKSWIAPGAILRDGLVIGDNATIGLGAVVLRNVEQDDVVAGVPAKSLRKKEKK